jgi:hypothetical protein
LLRLNSVSRGVSGGGRRAGVEVVMEAGGGVLFWK